jgi:hypothetical protein
MYGMIDFLQEHVSQLIQRISQLAPKFRREEIKAKHWYLFWK